MIMNNSDKPAMPYDHTFEDINGDIFRRMYTGLTKREHFAGLAMQGILANKFYDAPRRTKLEGMAIDAVAAANALLMELDK